MRRLSIVVPVLDEAASVGPFLARLAAALGALPLAAEILFVDDGSSDATVPLVRAARERDPRVKLVALSRHFGKEAAIAAGLRHAGGDAVVVIDGDGQHPPELIAALVAAWEEGFDVVYAQRRDRRDQGGLRRWATRGFYGLYRYLGEVSLPPGSGDFRLLDRRVVAVLNALPERTRFTKGLFSWVGFRQTGVPYDVGRRDGGPSRYSALRLAGAALDGLTSFSLAPLRLATLLGAAISLVAVAYAGYVIVKTLAIGRDWPGFPSLIVAILFMGGVQLLSLGIIGEYVGRIFLEVKRRPLYVVAATQGLDPEPAGTCAEGEAATPGGAPAVAARHDRGDW